MPTTYTSKAPGVYVEEVPSGLAPIAGVGTSTAGFIGVINLANPSEAPGDTEAATPELIPLRDSNQQPLTGRNGKQNFEFVVEPPLGEDTSAYQFFQKSSEEGSDPSPLVVEGDLEITAQTATVKFATAPARGNQLYATYTPPSSPADDTATTDEDTLTLPTEPGVVKLCTNFGEFKAAFGDFSEQAGQSYLAHAVYGFFRNGGTRCFVVYVTAEDAIAGVLENQFEAIDEIAIVAAPGVVSQAQTQAIADHCFKMTDRFAILDGPLTADLSSPDLINTLKLFTSDYAGLYFPWIQVYDLATKAEKLVPPSGHMAGIYARVDSQRGVHKAPANETVLGATGLAYNLSKAKQGPLNQEGINCIRSLNGDIRVWGARTLGGDANGEFKYISTRRLFNYLSESIDEGTQWTVFEPNSPELWAAIRRNVTAFLTMVWRSGALFGATPEQAFYVKCDAETNPPDLRELGQVVTEIGVAIVKPAEFVVFQISQWSGGEG